MKINAGVRIDRREALVLELMAKGENAPPHFPPIVFGWRWGHPPFSFSPIHCTEPPTKPESINS